jgi:hypothetical protein
VGDDAQVVNNTAGLHYKDHNSHSKWDDLSHTVRQIALTFLSTNTFVSRTLLVSNYAQLVHIPIGACANSSFRLILVPIYETNFNATSVASNKLLLLFYYYYYSHM